MQSRIGPFDMLMASSQPNVMNEGKDKGKGPQIHTARHSRNQKLIFATENTENTEKNKGNERKKNRGNQTFIHRFLRFTQIITDFSSFSGRDANSAVFESLRITDHQDIQSAILPKRNRLQIHNLR